MYILPKIHKSNIPLRPILAAYQTPAYNPAKYLVPLLTPYTLNSYTVKNSYDFIEQLKEVNLGKNYTMASFDISSLFTSVPLEETIAIICNKIYENTDTFNRLSRKDLRTFLSLASKESFFIFNEMPYQQIDGVSMGSPLGPTLANSFLCHHEQHWLSNCPSEFRPIYYRRYVDDTFAIFKDPSHPALFLNYLNQQHRNIQFTIELSNNKTLSFLDLTITQNESLTTSVYRKDTFTGLGTNYLSFTSEKYKINNVKAMLSRAYKLSSSFFDMSKEFEFLKHFFLNNGYPLKLFENELLKYLNNIYKPSSKISTVPKKPFFISLPYYSKLTESTYHSMRTVLSDIYPHIDFQLSPKSTFIIGSFFKFKDVLPDDVRSNVIYEFSCACCNTAYIGATSQRFKTRIDQHLGISSRTGRPLARTMDSTPRAHAFNHNHSIKSNNFKIIDFVKNSSELFILESLHINTKSPALNEQQISTALFISPV